MKRLINPLPTGGVPFENEDILTLQNEGFDSLKQICSGLPGAFVLSGCGSILGTETYYNSTQAVGIGYLTGNASIQVMVPAGYVWIDNDIKYFTGGVFTTPFYIKSDSPTLTKKTLQDGTLKNVYSESKAIGVNSKPTTGQYIACNPTPEFVFQDVVTAKVQTALNSEISTRQTSAATERTERTDAVTLINQRLSTLSDVVDSKMTKKIGRVGWTDMALTTGFTTETNPTPGGFNKAQYMRTEDGFVHLRGIVTFNSSYTGSPATTLPSGFNTLYETRFTTSAVYNSGEIGVRIAISFGNIYIFPDTVPNGTSLTIFLDSINFYADGTGGVQ